MYTSTVLTILKPFTPLFFGAWLAGATMPTAADLIYTPVQGQWVDRALSETLSKRYGHPVVVENVMLVKWSDVFFDKLRVYSPKGELLIRAENGRLTLRKMSPKKDMLYTTEIALAGVEFEAAYYKGQKQFMPWSQWVKKPIKVKALKLGVVQTDHFTGLSILDCRSDDVSISGYLVAHNAAVVQDKIVVKASALKMLRKLF